MFKFCNNHLLKYVTYLFTVNVQLHNYDTLHADDRQIPRKLSRLTHRPTKIQKYGTL